MYVGVEQSNSVSHEEYVNTNVSFVNDATIVMWNNVFTCLVVVSHMILTAVICTPNSLHFLTMMCLVYYTSFSVILQPKVQIPPDVSASSSSLYLIAVSLYTLGMFYVCNNISFDPMQCKVQLIIILLFFDLLMILGHIWDPVPLMTTIINCRFLYVVCVTLVNIAIYVLWDDLLKVPYVRIPTRCDYLV